MRNPIVPFEIMGRDSPELVEFYRSLFRWPLQTSEGITGYQHFAYLGDSEPDIGGHRCRRRATLLDHLR